MSLIRYYLKTKSFDEILNWSHYEKQFATACMLLDIEEKSRLIEMATNAINQGEQ